MASIGTTPDLSSALFAGQANKQNALSKPYTGSVSESDRTKMMTKATEFEAFYIYQVMELMAPDMEGAFTGGSGEEMFRHTLNEHMADAITTSGGFGISKSIYNQLLKQQEAHNAKIGMPADAVQAYSAN
ncbi:MAG: hypothetical protein DI585_05835 [Pseudomonas fluorescens]|nr:MAG: hypothetical protein DI585_05835 [Pseudomonas fluorescens]